ncbi:MAG: xanthine dehydrogenase family protein molybdopterin-binding subunit [Deltaproteobacteria bacterium]|nr:xanthine dehydrogenase family protein molybdopterin-binding subunit [Deltaproteobacteria bacterium]
MKTPISRRTFLKGSVAAGGLTLAVSVTPSGYSILNAAEKKDFSPSVWIRITPDDKVTITIGQSEMGQGVLTSQSMIIADELEADWKKVVIKQGPALDALKSPLFKSQVTVASQSMRAFYEPLRKAGAAGRAMLVKAAAQTWKVPEGECKAVMGKVYHEKSKKSLSYGQLCTKAAKLEVPKEPTLKKSGEFRYMGRPMPRVDVPEKVKGKAIYGLDVNVRGMVYAVTARPPAYGAEPVSFDEKAAMRVKGVLKVLKIPQGVAVVATSTEAALNGKDVLKVQWSKGTMPDLDTKTVEKVLMGDLDKPGAKVHSAGDAKKALADSARKLEATYYVPVVAHVTMETQNTTAWVQKDRCDIWAPTQAQTGDQKMGAKLTGLPPEKVSIHTTFLGCGLGRRTRGDLVAEAVTLSKAVGKPVKAMWTREDDINQDWFRAPIACRIQGGVDARGQLTAWSHKGASISITKSANPKAELKGGVDWYNMWGLWMGPTKRLQWNAEIQYEIPNFYVEFNLSDLPIRCCPWRSVTVAQHAFTIESFMDELAYAAKMDPLVFRLNALKNNKRAHGVLVLAAAMAGWNKPVPQGRGRGIAMASCFGTWVAEVAELSVDKSTGKIKVHKVWAAVDCGPVINPGPLVEQIESAIIIGLSTTLKEEVQFAKGGASSLNLDSYPIIRMSEVPDIEVEMVRTSEKIGGIGEPGVTPLAPAVANAVFNATGVRFRRIPLTPEVVLAGLKKA